MNTDGAVDLSGASKKSGRRSGLLLPATVTTAVVGTSLTVTHDGAASAVKATLGWDGEVAEGDRVWTMRAGAQTLVVARQNAYGKTGETGSDYGFKAYLLDATLTTAAGVNPVIYPSCAGSTYGYDPQGAYNATTGTWTCPLTGVWTLGHLTYIGSTATSPSTYYAAVKINGTFEVRVGQLISSPAGTMVGGSGSIYLHAGDTVQATYFNTYTGTIGYAGSSTIELSRFWANYEGPIAITSNTPTVTVTNWNSVVGNGTYYGAASTTNAPTTAAYIGNVFEGSTYVAQNLYNVSNGLAYYRVFNGSTWSAWVQQGTAPGTANSGQVVQQQTVGAATVGSNTGFTGSTWGVITNWPSLTFTKQYAATRLMVQGSMSSYATVTAGLCLMGLSFSTSGYIQIGQFYFNALSTHAAFAIGAEIPSIPSGTQTIEPCVKPGSTTWNIDSGDYCSYTVSEVW